MAHFAKINENNEVLTVLYVNDSDCLNDQNVETESVGQAYLETHNNWPAAMWIKTSYNTYENTHKNNGTPFRGNYAGIGFTWDSENNIFWPPKPHNSWIKNNSTASWIAPIAKPNLTAEQQSQNDANTNEWFYTWDDDLYQSDNTQGWVLSDLLA
jgi:hypothetical protein